MGYDGDLSSPEVCGSSMGSRMCSCHAAVVHGVRFVHEFAMDLSPVN